ncbi:MAG TPA: ParA family protein [Jiangellales bacterium]|nr:ParA family protein [Jiangellales bacterium]
MTLRGARAAASRAGGPVLRARTPDRGVGDPAVEGDLTLDRTPDGVGPDEALDTSPDTAADALLDTVAGGAVGPTGRPLPHFPEPPVLHHHGPARVVAMCNQKGGVGKTTSTINLGASLAGYGRRVLLVDFDPQGALSVGLGVNPHERDLSVYNVLMERSTSAADVLLKTNVPGMDLLPSNIDLSAAEVQLVSEVAREHVLRRALAPLLPEYDVVLVDCQPSLGLLTINALTAADGVIVPLECEFFALRGVALLQETIDKVGERLNERLVIDGLLATMYDSRTVHAREVVHRLVEAFGDKVFHTVVSRTVRFPESTVAQTPITSYAPASPGADAYRTLAREVLHRWDS